jgi:ubiquinone/menaquinone biosynthesis C-methylase UbiE
MDAPRIFTPEYYQRMRDLEAVSWWNAGMRDVAALLLDLASLPETGRLLDVGCGSGQTMEWFARMHPAWRTIGVDVASEGLAAARARGLTEIVRGSALALPLPDRSVDLVMTLDVLQHLPLDGGDGRALAEIVRVLKPGGYVFLRTNAQSFPYTPDDAQFAFHKYDETELRMKLRAASVQVVRLSRVNALLGLAEIPRELSARREEHSYHGLLSEAKTEPRWQYRLKRSWLRIEGRAVRAGARWPIGRAIVALCRR